MSFSPFDSLAARLLPELDPGDDGSHDIGHLARVWANARAIQAEEGGDAELLAAAVLLHDCVHVEKSSPLRARASRLAAERARRVLAGLGWDGVRIEAAAHAIAAHSFSAGIAPETLEARILQDADRLEALGAIGIARLFYTAGRMGSLFYDPADPRAERRALDDRAFAIDHFRAKLLRLEGSFQTATGKRLARERTRLVADFLAAFEAEIGLPDPAPTHPEPGDAPGASLRQG
jgi:uncharacterized protein